MLVGSPKTIMGMVPIVPEIAIQTRIEVDYISLADIAKYKSSGGSDHLTPELAEEPLYHRVPGHMGAPEQPGSKRVEFGGFRKQGV